ncbi:MAG: hypothetical protein SPK55_09375, partial [Succinivibrio sp.]|nr:hypothetical protein [Succinivibrio sp.]
LTNLKRQISWPFPLNSIFPYIFSCASMYGFILENYDLRIMWGYRVVTVKNYCDYQRLDDYWSASSTFKEPMLAIEQNFDGLHDSILDLLAENAFVDLDIHRYKNLITKIENKESAIVYLIHLGYLSYQEFDDKSNKISIPNEEVRQEFIREIEGMDYS